MTQPEDGILSRLVSLVAARSPTAAYQTLPREFGVWRPGAPLSSDPECEEADDRQADARAEIDDKVRHGCEDQGNRRVHHPRNAPPVTSKGTASAIEEPGRDATSLPSSLRSGC
jgi:hypothetical protein